MIKQSNRYGWQTRLVAMMWLKGLRIWAFRSLEMTHYRFSLTRLVSAQPWVVHNLWCHYKLISASIALPLWHVKALAVRRHSTGNIGLKFSSILVYEVPLRMPPYYVSEVRDYCWMTGFNILNEREESHCGLQMTYLDCHSKFLFCP